MTASDFARLVHADGSTQPGKHWAAQAFKTSTGWPVEAPRLASIPSSVCRVGSR